MEDTSSSTEVWHRPFVKQHQHWCDEFVIELRLLDVPGPVIGDRLAEVESHCLESGQTPAEAFGDATDYARQLDEDRSPELSSGVWRVAVIAAVQVLALLVGTSAAGAWAREEQLSYNAVQLGSLAVFVLVLLSLPVLLRPMLERPWSVALPVLAVGMLGGVGAAVAGGLQLPAVMVLPPATVAIGLFVVVLVLAWAEHRELSRDAGDDLVTSPLAPATQPPRRRRRWAAVLPAVLIPVAYVVLSALSWLAA